MALHPGLWVVEFSNLGLVLGIVWNMTEKPGWGGTIAAMVIGYVAGASSVARIPCSARGVGFGRRVRGSRA